MTQLFFSAVQGFSFGFGLLVAMVPAVWLIKRLPASPDVKKGILQNAELLELREIQNQSIQQIAVTLKALEAAHR